MPSPTDTLNDPEFQSLPVESRRRILSKVDPEFAKLPEDAQGRILEKAASKPSVGGRIARRAISTLGGALNPIPPASAAFRSLTERNNVPGLEGFPNPKPLYEQFVAPQVEQFKKAGQQLQRVGQGDLSGIPGAVMYGSAGLFPGFGPAITSAVEEATPVERGGSGRTPEAIGTLIGVGASAPAQELVMRGAGRVARAAARPMERSTLSFGEDVSLPERPKITEKALELGTATAEKGLLGRRGGLEKLSDYIQQKTAEVDKIVQDMISKGQLVDTYPILDEVDKQAARYGRGYAPTVPQAAANAVRRDVYLRLGGQEVDIAVPGGGIQKRLVRGPRYMDPEENQLAKRETSRQLRDEYGEEKSPSKETLKAAERGGKRSMEEGAAAVGQDIKDPNWQEHVALTLKDSIERTLKKQPAFLDKYGLFILGGGSIGVMGDIWRGAPENIPAVVGATGVSLLVEKALRNPAVMSRLAIALDRAGTTLPKIAGGASKIQPALTLGKLAVPTMPPSRLDNSP